MNTINRKLEKIEKNIVFIPTKLSQYETLLSIFLFQCKERGHFLGA
jgi:hypothetical protein